MPATSSLPRFIRFGAQNTRKNLPYSSSSKRGESNFLSRFERAYFAQGTAHAGVKVVAGREFSLDGYGRADVLWLAWRQTPDAEDFSAVALNKRIHVTAIEAKLKDWRKGLQQASRYRHFANRALLILPSGTAKIALEYIEAFRRLNVGLWEFDPITERITKHTTPRIRKAMNAKAREKAIQVIHRSLNLG
jgi:hypothetical protein